jgi:hypothetical protein
METLQVGGMPWRSDALDESAPPYRRLYKKDECFTKSWMTQSISRDEVDEVGLLSRI